jgi:molybdopterin-guanine dinucleotide biosynthesis protein A
MRLLCAAAYASNVALSNAKGSATRLRGAPITGAILAGGPASRFGGLPKGLQIVGGERIIDRVARGLRSITGRLLVISNDPHATEWLADAKVAGDLLLGRASLVGIHSALSRAGGDVIVVAWDMPFVPVALLEEMGTRLRRGVTAVIPFGPGGPEPVCAAYAGAALPHVERLAASGVFTLSALVDELPNVERIPLVEVAQFGDPDVIFFNVNTPEDRERAEAIARAL